MACDFGHRQRAAEALHQLGNGQSGFVGASVAEHQDIKALVGLIAEGDWSHARQIRDGGAEMKDYILIPVHRNILREAVKAAGRPLPIDDRRLEQAAAEVVPTALAEWTAWKEPANKR